MIAGWIILSVLCGIFASNRGRSFFGYFLLSLLLSPLIGFIAVLIATDNQKIEKQNHDDKKEVDLKKEKKVEDLERELEQMKKTINELKEEDPQSATGKMK
tara:strand:+ start:73 stop:375 length:303 start_codon:yes stop_codon:yes gene_type:complete